MWEGTPGASPSAKSGSPWLALILAGTAVNQDGRSSSLTTPNGPSQQQVLYPLYSRFKGQYIGFKAYQNP